MNTYLLPEEKQYLIEEDARELRHEYIDGEIHIRVPSNYTHNIIVSNFSGALLNKVERDIFDIFVVDIKVKTGTKFFYPDIILGNRKMYSRDDIFIEYPTSIIEVISPQTRKRDRTVKKDSYLKIPTLQEYVLVEQDFVDVEVFRRSDDWRSDHYFLGDSITFDSIDVTLSVEEIYERTKNEDMTEWLAKKEEESTD